MKRLEKESFVVDVKNDLQSSSVVIALERSAGITVSEITELRKSVNKAGANFKILKNTLAKIAMKDSHLEGLCSYLKGSTAIAYSNNPVETSKALYEYSKKNEKLQILCGIIDGNFANKDDISVLATLPSLDELRGKIAGLVMENARKVMRTIKEPSAMITRLVATRK